MTPKAVCDHLDAVLEVAAFSDSSLNGLQVDAGVDVERIVCGVSANGALIAEAEARRAQLIVVHHGLLWGRCERLTGLFGQRVQRLYQAGLSLAGYHLPLDAHPTLGNNAGLTRCLALEALNPFGDYKGKTIGWGGRLARPQELGDVCQILTDEMGAISHCFGALERPISRIALCSGAASELIHEAAAGDYDLFVTGEVEEWTQAQALELGIAVIAGGHHRTERFGPQSLAQHLSETLGLPSEFVDVINPV